MNKKIDELIDEGNIGEAQAKELKKELDGLLMMRNEVKKPIGNLAAVAKQQPKVIEKVVGKVVEVEVEKEVEKIVEVEKKDFSKEEILELVQGECNKDYTFLNWLVGKII